MVYTSFIRAHKSDIRERNCNGDMVYIPDTQHFIENALQDGSVLKNQYEFLNRLHGVLKDKFAKNFESNSSVKYDCSEKIFKQLKQDFISINKTFSHIDNYSLIGHISKRYLNDEGESFSEFLLSTADVGNKDRMNDFISQAKYFYNKYVSYNNTVDCSGNYVDLICSFAIDDKVNIKFPFTSLYKGAPDQASMKNLGYYISGIKVTLDSSYYLNHLNDHGLDIDQKKRLTYKISSTLYNNICFYPNVQNSQIANSEIYKSPYEIPEILGSLEYKNNLRNDIKTYFHEFNTFVSEYVGENILDDMYEKKLLSKYFFRENAVSQHHFLEFLKNIRYKIQNSPQIIDKDIDMLSNALLNNIYTKRPELLVTGDSKLKVMAYILRDFLSINNYERYLDKNKYKKIAKKAFVGNYNRNRYRESLHDKLIISLILTSSRKGISEYHEIFTKSYED